ncbi:MAG: protein-tyrosine phosphatase [Actinomycetota bacterium]|nr:protein-tyrosine phosphatase [Actinomycetota bacterium]
MATPAWIELAGASNVRDVGGLRAGDRAVRRGVLLRSDHLDDATTDDLTLLAGKLGLRGVVDLRVAAEDPRPPAWDGHGVEVLPLPLFDLSGTTDRSAFRGDQADAYGAMLDLAGASLVAILQFVLRAEGAPVLIHCAAGKDRTGIAVAVLLAAAGVDHEDIVADYLATDERLQRVRAQLATKAAYDSMATNPLLAEAMTADPIERVLHVIGSHVGGAEGYLVAHGATPAEIQRWRSIALAEQEAGA